MFWIEEWFDEKIILEMKRRESQGENTNMVKKRQIDAETVM